MILRKRYKRDIKHSLSLYVSSTLLTVFSLLLFYLYIIAGAGITDFANEKIDTQKLEDANFSTYLPIPDEEIEAFEEKYNLVLEKQEYINIETNGVNSRIFAETHKIDIPWITEGNAPINDNEIVISEGYAVENNVKIGDLVKIKDKDYKITGFVERPDYLFMLESIGDIDKNTTSFYIAYMTENAFEKLGEKSSQYLVKYNEDNNKEFRKAVSEKYFLSSYLAAKDNIRINMLTEQPKLFIQMAYVILFTLPVMAVLLISVILSRKIKGEQKMIGTLAACGYTKKQITSHYIGFSAIPGILGGILTTIIVAIFAEPYGAMGLMDYEPLDIQFKMEFYQMALGIIVPTIMYILSTVLTLNRLLKKDIVQLLAGTAGGKHKVKKYFVGKKVSFRTKFNIRSIMGNFGRTFVLFLGVFLGSSVVIFSLGSWDTVDNVINNSTQNMANYQYQYVLGELKTDKLENGETILAGSLENDQEKTISLMGVDDNELIGLKDMDGNAIEIPSGKEAGYYVSSLYAVLYNTEKGDMIKLTNPITMDEFNVKVAGIVENDFANAVYTSKENVSSLTGIGSEYYNIVLSNQLLDLPEKSINSIINRDTLKEQYEVSVGQMSVMINLFVVVGIVLCIISVYIGTNMIVMENRRNISMLQILGYNDKKIERLLLNDNIWIVILAIICSIPAVIYGVNALFLSFVDILGYYMEVYIKPSTYVFGALLVLASYFVSKYFVGRKISKISMVESLKDERE